MLGLQSNIQEPLDVSCLSVSSNTNTATKGQNSSTNYPSSCEKEDLSEPCLQLESNHKESSLNIPKPKDLKIRLNYLTAMQENLNKKMNGIVDVLEKGIKSKEQQNDQVERIIQSLRREVEESRTDIITLSELLNKRKKAANKPSKQTNNHHYDIHRKVNNGSPNVKNLVKNPTSQDKISAYSPSNKARPGFKRLRCSPTPKQAIQIKQNITERQKQQKKTKTTKMMGSSPFTRKKLVTSP